MSKAIQLELAAVELRATKDYLQRIEVNYCNTPLRNEVLELLRAARTSINAAVRELQKDMNAHTDELVHKLLH